MFSDDGNAGLGKVENEGVAALLYPEGVLAPLLVGPVPPEGNDWDISYLQRDHPR